MKLCPSCGKEKPLSEFSIDKKSKDGLCYYCKECASEKSRTSYNRKKQNQDWYIKYREGYKESYRQRKKEAVELLGGKCQDCGGVFPQCVYDFHHVDMTEKELNPSKALTKSNWQEELSKCVLLCSNCHRIRHWNFEGERENDRSI
jgi:5-methylcytosine-specific restriction endonuclease McrA